MIKDSHVRTLRRVAFHRRRIIQSTHSSLFSLLIYSYHNVNQSAADALTRPTLLCFAVALRFFHARACVITTRTADRYTHARTTTTMPNTIKLRSSDDETFEVDEDVALYVSTRTTEDAQ